MKRRGRILASLLGSAALVACGGGVDGGGGNGDAAVGVFVDGAVAGLLYVGPNHLGITNDDGEYDYEPGDEVLFFLGDLLLGRTEGRGVVTPIDLFDDVEPGDNKVLNVVRLLMSLDEDGDPDNGIDVRDVETDESHADIDFDQSEADFANDALVSNLVTNEGHDGSLPTAAEAEMHFEGSLETNDYWEQILLGDFIVALQVGSVEESDLDLIQLSTETFSEDDLDDMSVDADDEEISFEFDLGYDFGFDSGEATCNLDGEWVEEKLEDGASMISIAGDVFCPTLEGAVTSFVAYSIPDDVEFDDDDLTPAGGYHWVVSITFGGVGESPTFLENVLSSPADAVARNASINSSGEVEFDAENPEIGYDCTLTGQMIGTKDEMYGDASCTGPYSIGRFRAERQLAEF